MTKAATNTTSFTPSVQLPRPPCPRQGPQGGSSCSIIVEDYTITAPTAVSARQYEAVRDERKIKRSLHANMTGGNR